MKPNCNKCIALENGKCTLGFKNKPNLYVNGKIRGYKPLEKCPKPKTPKSYLRHYNRIFKGE